MRIKANVKPNSKKESVEFDSDTQTYCVRVNCPPIEGRANQRVIELLAEHFQCKKAQVTLILGGKSKIKIFDIGTV